MTKIEDQIEPEPITRTETSVQQSVADFVIRLVGGLAEDSIGIVHDQVKFFRLSRLTKLQDRAEQILTERGARPYARCVTPKFAIPLLEAASLEDEDDINELWARLLANAMDPNCAVNMKRAFINILADFEPTDAYVLNYMCTTSEYPKRNILSEVFYKGRISMVLKLSDSQTEVTLRNLIRLGCVRSEFHVEDIDIEDRERAEANTSELFLITPLGFDLFTAVT